MAKAKKKKPGGKEPARAAMPSAAEQLQAARREMRQLRELKSLLNQIRRKRLDNEAEGVALARVLVASTFFVVSDELTLKQLEHDLREARATITMLTRELDAAKQHLNPETV